MFLAIFCCFVALQNPEVATHHVVYHGSSGLEMTASRAVEGGLELGIRVTFVSKNLPF